MTDPASSVHAFIRPSDRSLTVCCDRDAFLRVAPRHLFDGPSALRGRLSDGTMNSTLADWTDLDFLIVAKLEHEIDHLHRTMGTSYGLMLHLIHSRQIDLFLRRIDVARSGHKIQLPLEGETSNSLLREFQDYDRLSEALACSRLGRSGPAGLGLERLTHLIDELPRRPNALASPLVAGPDETVAPILGYTLGSSPRTAPFGGHAILEYLTLSRELGLRNAAKVFYDRATQLVQVAAYQHVGQVWKEAFGIPQAAVGRTPLPSELYVACDLALWAPFGPDGVIESPSGRPTTWRDIHPGWRFVRIVEHLARRGTQTPSNRPLDEEYNRWFSAVESNVCEALDWVPPNRIAAEWLRFLEASTRLGSFERAMIEDDGERTDGSIKVLRRRLRSPGMAAHGYWSAGNDNSLWFSACTILGRSQAENLMVSVDDNRLRHRALGYHFPASVSLTSALQLFARKRPEAFAGPELLGRYSLEGRHAASDLSLYAKRHYGFSIEFGRDEL